MLREDVVGRLEALLMRVNEAAGAESKVCLYYEGVTEALTNCRRLIDPAGDDVGSTGTSPAAEPANLAEAEALELQMLRRDLSAAKIALADERAQREAAEHELRTLQAQSARNRKSWI